MPEHDTPNLELDEDTEQYLSIALYAQSGGFSKGTANVSHHDVTKLKGLLKYYEKKPHPFTACVKDNRKRFGDNTEKYCAVLKDLIVGNTKWRKGGKHTAKGTKLSEEALVESFALDIPEGFFAWLADAPVIEQGEDKVDLATGEVAWSDAGSWNTVRRQIEAQLNANDSSSGGMEASDYAMGPSYWVDDVNGDEALVCAGGDHYVAPFSVDKKGGVTLSDEADWKPVDQAWVESSAKFSLSEQLGAEMYFADDVAEAPVESDGLIWKTLLREGTWKMSPGPGQRPVAKPITVIKDGVSDGKNFVVSMQELKDNFDAGVVEHVTIPLSHDDKVHENTGFVKSLRFEKDSKGREVLKAGMDFTEPDIKEKALRGTIANTSAGILFDYINKETGTKNSAVLGHAALTNHPWLNDMNPFGVMASENLKVLAFSEETEVITPDTKSGGGDKMDEVLEVATPKFLTDLGLSEDEAASRLARYEELEKRDREFTIKAKVDGWEADHKAPALVVAAKALLSAASDTDTVLNLSEDGKTVGLTAVDVIDRLMAASPNLTLSEDQVSDKEVAGDKPAADAEDENATANLSQQEKTLVAELFLTEGLSGEEAVAEAKRRLGKSE